MCYLCLSDDAATVCAASACTCFVFFLHCFQQMPAAATEAICVHPLACHSLQAWQDSSCLETVTDCTCLIEDILPLLTPSVPVAREQHFGYREQHFRNPKNPKYSKSRYLLLAVHIQLPAVHQSGGSLSQLLELLLCQLLLLSRSFNQRLHLSIALSCMTAAVQCVKGYHVMMRKIADARED